MPLSLSLACGPYDRTNALMNGDVRIEGCDVNAIALTPEESFHRSFGESQFDIAELSFSTYLIQTSRGTCDYVGIPAFLSRMFRHSAIYVRSDRIRTPSDLKDAKVGVPEYQVTAAVWVRGLLEDEFGVAPSMLDWVSGGVEEVGRSEKTAISLPDDIRISAATDRPLSDMLADGELDAIIAPRMPSCFAQAKPNIGRLFPDYRIAEAAYYRKTGLFPIMHLVGIRKSLVERNPWLPASAMKAFEQSRRRSLKTLTDPTALHVSLPWLIAEMEETQAIMGPDFWSYGVEKNLKDIETLLDYHHRQGLSHRRLSIDELFAPGSTAGVKI